MAGDDLDRGGHPVGRLGSAEQPATRRLRFVNSGTGDDFFEPLPAEELAGWESPR